MTDITIETIERRVKPGLMPSLYLDHLPHGTPDQDGWYARITVEGGASMDVSKLDGETGWTCDATYGPTGLPGFVNGYGARYLRTRQVVDEIAAQLDAAAAEAVTA